MTSCHLQQSFLFPSENGFGAVPDRLPLRDAELIFDPVPAGPTQAQMTSLLRSNLPDGKPQGLLHGALATCQRIMSEAARQAGEGKKKGFLEGRAEVRQAQPTVLRASTHGMATA